MTLRLPDVSIGLRSGLRLVGSRGFVRAAWSGLSRRRGWILVSLLGGAVGSALGCGGDTATSIPERQGTQAFWALQLSQHAVNMALTPPYNSLQLTATPLTEAGTPLMGVGSATFSHTDSTVTVSTSGVLTAHYATPQTMVIASLQVRGVTLADTVFVQVTDTVPQHALATFSMQPAPGDSAKRTLDDSHVLWPVTAMDVDGNTVCDANGCPLLVSYSSSNSAVVGNSIPLVTFPGNAEYSLGFPGHTKLIATTWAYGVAKRDSVDFTVGLSLYYTDFISGVPGGPGVQFSAPSTLVLGVGAVVDFLNGFPHPVGVDFDHITGIDTASFPDRITGAYVLPTGFGNLTAFGGDTTCPTAVPVVYCRQSGPSSAFRDENHSARRFVSPGIYQYHSTLLPTVTYYIDIDDDR